MNIKELRDYRIDEIKRSDLSDKTKNILIRMLCEFWPEFELKDPSITCYYITCERGDFLTTVPEWLYDVFDIFKTKYKHVFDGGYGYTFHVPGNIFMASYNFSSKLSLAEETECNTSLNLVKSEKLAKGSSLDELKNLQKKLECELGIVTRAIDIKKKENSKQKVYKRNR